MINVLLPFKSLHPNAIIWPEPTLNSRLPVIVSLALDTFKASRSSTYFLLVKCLSFSGTAELFVVASFVSSTAWDQLTTSSPTYMGGWVVGNPFTNLLLLKIKSAVIALVPSKRRKVAFTLDRETPQ